MSRQASLLAVSFASTKKTRRRASLALHPAKYNQCELRLIRAGHYCWKLYRGACAVHGEASAETGALFDACETIWAAKKAFRQEFGVRP